MLPLPQNPLRAQKSNGQPKQSRVIEMLHDEGGTSLPELIEVTGWQAHTVRSALTGLRKKGHAIERFSVDGVTRYRIVAVAAA